ncbi:MAG: hypothetical protein Q9M36_03970 [Sulfurovum sp.]|nr:hypothetical protein [Sulfurovum sp.]
MPISETNSTQTLNVIDDLSMNLHHTIQDLLTPLYTSDYGDFFLIFIFGIPLAQWLGATLIFFTFFGLTFFFYLYHYGYITKTCQIYGQLL